MSVEKCAHTYIHILTYLKLTLTVFLGKNSLISDKKLKELSADSNLDLNLKRGGKGKESRDYTVETSLMLRVIVIIMLLIML